MSELRRKLLADLKCSDEEALLHGQDLKSSTLF